MAQKIYDIFISYRREGGADKARALKTELESRGYIVFLDFDELKDGVFDKRIMDAIDSSPIFMFLLTPHSLERCVNEDDLVRKEIEYAVDNHKHIIPINPDREFKSFPDDLSAKVMDGLGQHQHTDVMFGQLFKASINELINLRVLPILTKWGRDNAATGATIHIETDLDCRILRFGKEIGLAQAGEYSEVKIPKGKHKLKFVGLENAADKYECLLTVEDIEFEDFIEIKLLDKYNARKAKEEAERQRLEAEKRAKAEREAYLLGFADDEFGSFEENGKYGYKLKSSGEIVVPLKYYYADSFSEGLAMVILNDKYGFIDKTGKEVIPLKYDNACSFSEGLARVKLNDKYGLIDKIGKEVIPFKYDCAWSFREGLAAVGLNDKWGFIDKTGKEIIPLKYDWPESFSEGLAAVKLNGKWGFIDKTGKEVIPLKYDNACSFSEGLARVKLNDKYGLIDKTGKEVIPLKYDSAELFREGLARVELNGKYGFIDKTGKEVIPLKYDYAERFRNGEAHVKLNGEWFYIDKNGNRIEE